MDSSPEKNLDNIEAISFTRKEIFLFLKSVLNENINVVISIVEKEVSKKMKHSYILPKSLKNALSKLLSNFKKKWQQVTRNETKFFRKFDEWLNVPVSFTIKEEGLKTPMENTMGRPSTSSDDLSDRSKRRRTEKVRNEHTVHELAYATQMSLRASGNLQTSKVIRDVTEWSPSKTSRYCTSYERVSEDVLSGNEALSLVVEDWTNMCEQAKNYIKYEIAESTQSSREIMKKTCLSSDDSDDVEEPTEDLRKASNRKKRKSEKVVSNETAIMATNCSKNKEEGCNQLVNGTSSPNGDDEELQQYSKTDLISTIQILRGENKCLREENARLKIIRSVNDDLPEMKKLSTEILRNLRATSVLVGLYSSAESRSHRTENSATKNSIASSTSLPTAPVDISRANFPEEQYDAVENTSSALSSPEKELESRQVKMELPIFEEGSYLDDRSSMKDGYSDREMSPALSVEDGPKPIPDQEFSPHDEAFAGHQYFIQENRKLKEEFVDLGAGCMVDADQLSKCSRKNATKMTCDILSLIFTREELASSSLTGKVPNTHKKAGIRAKKKLDPAKVAAISAFVVQEFSATATKGEILTAIKNKCNNTAKAVRREKERSFNTVVQCSETV